LARQRNHFTELTKPFFRGHEAWLKPIHVIDVSSLAKWDCTMTKTFRQTGLMLGIAFGLCVASTSSFAFSAEAQQMCTGDAFRLCSSDIPNIPAITACMLKHRADLSVGCRTLMDRDSQKGS
jgi:hypothetical protein